MNSKPKTLPSSLREKKRYLAFEVRGPKPVSYEDTVAAFWSSVLNLLGEVGTSQTSVWFVKDTWNESKQRGLIRVDHTHVEQVRAALALIENVRGTPVVPYVMGVSGTMKAAKKKFMSATTLSDYVE